MRNLEEIIYSLNIEDIQTIAEENLERHLTEEELNLVIDNLPGYIDWGGAISSAIREVLFKMREADQKKRRS
ncbi:MAG TPA: hypothetical protein VIK33_05750 [Anaerolineae bacterium]